MFFFSVGRKQKVLFLAVLALINFLNSLVVVLVLAL